MSGDRVSRLDEIGFLWAVYRKNQPVKAAAVERKSVPAPVKAVEPGPEEHLYLVSGEYIQYGGSGSRPAKLEKYIKFHGGELPPSIILPNVPTVFRIGNTNSARAFVRKFKWSGKGSIPSDVLECLNENGVLPPHS